MNENVASCVIAGYPKSGTHWVSWLLANILRSPVVMHLPVELGESIGPETVSIKPPLAKCYKTHLFYDQIIKCFDPCENVKIIHVIRDPRDIVVSGAAYFPIVYRWMSIIKSIPGIKYIYGKLMWEIDKLIPTDYKKKRMASAVLIGDSQINSWMETSWEDYIGSFKGSLVYEIRYEDLLHDPVSCCKNICDFLAIEVLTEDILSAVNSQSISNRKNLTWKGYRVVREGKSGYWKDQLDETTLKEISHKLKQDLSRLEYNA